MSLMINFRWAHHLYTRSDIWLAVSIKRQVLCTTRTYFRTSRKHSVLMSAVKSFSGRTGAPRRNSTVLKMSPVKRLDFDSVIKPADGISRIASKVHRVRIQNEAFESLFTGSHCLHGDKYASRWFSGG